MKQQLVKQILAAMTLLLLVAGCSKDAVTDALPDATDRISLTIQVSTEGFSSTDSHSTRAADVGYTTVFQQGDRLGIVAMLYDGSKQNLCATYNAVTRAWTWEGEAVYYDPQTTYLSAYFPYTAALTDRLGSISDAAGVVSALKTLMPPLADQSSLDAYRASDLLTGTCALNTAVGGSKSLNISLAHAYSLLVLRAGTEYTTDGGFTYRAALQSVQVIVDDVYYTPLASAEDHRLIVDKSGSSPSSVEWFYTLPSGKTYKTSGSGSLAEGKYHLYTNITSTETRNLAVGDFYYSDGSIAPNDAPNPPNEGCIGVVYCVDNDFIKNKSTKKEKGGYTHALVVALRDAGTSNWHDAPAVAAGYETKAAAPDNSSGWYLPNFDELKYICWGNSTSQSTDGKTALNTQFAKLATGNEFVFGGDWYWSSSEISSSRAYCVLFGNGNTGWGSQSYGYSFRSSLAF